MWAVEQRNNQLKEQPTQKKKKSLTMNQNVEAIKQKVNKVCKN